MSDYNQSTYAPAPSGAPVQDQSKKFPVIGIVGSLVALIGAFTVWCVVKAGEMGEDRYKATDGDGVIVIVVALIAAALFVGAIVAKKNVLNLGGAVLSLVSLIIAGINMADPERLAKQVAEDETGATSAQIDAALKQVDVSSGPGVYITIIGALVALVFGVVAFMQGRTNR